MANRYCNLVGTNKIKDEYTKINDGFDTVEQEMDAALSTAQAAQNTANAALPRRIFTSGTYDFNNRGDGSFIEEVKSNASITFQNGPPGVTSGTLLQGEGSHNKWQTQLYMMQGDDRKIFFRTSADANDTKEWHDWVELITSAGGQTINGELTLRGDIRVAKPAPRIYLHRTDTSNNHAGLNAVNTDGSVEQYELLYDYVMKNWVIWDKVAGVGHKIWSAKDSGPFFKGAGSPEGVVAAPVGSIYQRTDGGTSSTLYVKESGSGNTGWKAVQTA